MRRAFPLLLATLLALSAAPARAHVGSPDVFSDGNVGPYPARITIRMPPVVPGRAEIDVQAPASAPLEVSYLPLYAKTAIKNAPPAEQAKPVPGSPGLYRGELWLMSVGAYSIEVRLRGSAGEGAIQIPVNSVATHQLPLPPLLGGILSVLGVSLIFGVVAIVRAAASESVVLPGTPLQPSDRRKGLIAAAISAVVVVLALTGGWLWWKADERHFRRTLREGPWPDLAASVQVEGGQRVLHLLLGEKEFGPDYSMPLIPDHGKLLHLFLIRTGSRDVFAHLHPTRTGGKEFVLALPPIPAGDYQIFCDLTLANSAVSSTASTTVHVSEDPGAAPAEVARKPDPDDSWATVSPASPTGQDEGGGVFRLPDGIQVIWRAHPPLRTRQNAALEFDIKDAKGEPVALQPYMGMLSHAAVMREDGKVFSHLHPSGNFSMAAQSYFQQKMKREAGAEPGGAAADEPIDHAKMGHGTPAAANSSLSLPYEFPSAGRYRVWLQFKTGDQVKTAVFDCEVAENPAAT